MSMINRDQLLEAGVILRTGSFLQRFSTVADGCYGEQETTDQHPVRTDPFKVQKLAVLHWEHSYNVDLSLKSRNYLQKD